jgi:hypothetical protein
MALVDQVIAAAGALVGAGLGGFVTYRVAGPAWERAKLSAVGPLTQARLPRYQDLWELTNVGSKPEPKDLTAEERLELTERIRAWYYDHGAGLLLSDDARRQWEAVQGKLSDEASPAPDIWRAMSCLRTRLKQDLHVHDPTIDDESCRQQPGWTR